MFTLLQSLIDMQLIKLKAFKPLNQPFDVLALLSNILSIYVGEAKRNGVRVKNETKSSEPAVISSDNKRLAVILENTLVRAL